MKRRVLFLVVFGIILFTFLSLVSASNVITSVNVDYNFSGNSFYSRIVNSNHFDLIIKTNRENFTCKYSESSGKTYVEMSDLTPILNGNYKATLSGLDGEIKDYYFKCVNNSANFTEPPETHVRIRIDVPVSVTSITFPDVTTPMLPAGRFKILVQTSKSVQGTPTFKYSFDGTKFNPLPLFSVDGSGKNWMSYLIIPSTIREGVVYFQFKGVDLEGNSGDQIATNYGSFPIDTQKPRMITDIVAQGNVGEITLNWNLDSENIDHYIIYRSNSPGVQYTDEYTNTTQEPYKDYAALKGKTYYYRVAAVDEAGNVGDLSKEVSSTSLDDNATVTSSGLSPSLLGQVQNFLIKADSVLSSIESIKSSISLKGDEEKQLFSDLGFGDKLDKAVSQIKGIERDANTLKLQDLTQQELSSQIDTLTLKLQVAEKQIPEGLAIIDHGSDTSVPSEEDITKALLEYNSSFSQSEVSRAVEGTVDYIKSSGLQIKSDYYEVQITYFDGSTNTLSVVSRSIEGQVERMDSSYFIETVPKEIASSSSDLNVMSGSFKVVKSDPILSFATDTKKILYYVDGKNKVSSLKSSKLVLIKISPSSSGSFVTGSLISVGPETKTYGGVGLGVLIAIFLLIYFLFLKKKNLSERGKEFLSVLEKLSEEIKKEDLEKSKEIYGDAREKYRNLNPKEKKIFYPLVEEVPKKILHIKKEDKK